MQLTIFDYAQLEPEVRAVAVEAAAKIKLHGRRAAESIVAIGEELARVKAALPHGAWLPWLEAEFGWSDQHARRFIHVHEFAKSNNLLSLGEIDVSALYLLARPSTPEPVREAAVERAAAGERVTHASVKAQLAEVDRKVERAFPRDPAPTWAPSMIEHAAEDEPEAEAQPPSYDHAARARFDMESDLVGSFRMFTAAQLDPEQVADAIDPIVRPRQLENAQRLLAWLHAFAHRLKEIRDAA